MNIYLILSVNIVLGTLYYYMMEASLPKKSNCSFISSVWTDILAFGVGIIIILRGKRYNDYILVFLGGSIIVEHIWQLFPKFTINKITGL